MRKVFILLFTVVSVSASAQIYESGFHVTLNTLKTLSDNEFIDRTSSNGVRLGYSKFLSDRFGFGIEGGYSVLQGHDPYQTYFYEGGSISYESYRYVYYYTLMANGQYYFMQGKHFIPYASLGAGVAFSQYKEFYNVYQEADDKTAFALRPEVGTLFRVKEHAGWGLKAAIGYDYTTNKSDYFGTDNLSSLNFQFGFVFLTH